MSATYGEVPPGGIVNIPPSIPQGMLYRVKSLAGISKQTLKLTPLSGQTQVTNGGKIIVALPTSSLVDLSTFELNFTGYTQHGGNGAAWATTAGTATNTAYFVNKRYFPRNIASLIENLEIKIMVNHDKILISTDIFIIYYQTTCLDMMQPEKIDVDKIAIHLIKLLIIMDNYSDMRGSLLVVLLKVLITHSETRIHTLSGNG
jgi:hypothetical protein